MRGLVGIAVALLVLVAAVLLATPRGPGPGPVDLVASAEPRRFVEVTSPDVDGPVRREARSAPAPTGGETLADRGRGWFVPSPEPEGGPDPSGDFRLRGRVVSAAGHLPIAGARIVARWRDERESAVSAYDGSFEFLVPETQTVLLLVEADGFVGLRGRVGRRDTDEGPLEARLTESAVLDVTVVDRKDVPHRGARVRVAVLEPESPAAAGLELDDRVQRELTDRDGRARVDGLPRGAQVLLQVSVGTAEHEESMRLDPWRPTARRVVLARGGTIEGRLVLPNGVAARHRLWLVRAAPRAGPAYLDASADPADWAGPMSDGSFRFDDVEPGTWRVGPRPDSEPDDLRAAMSSWALPVQVPEAGATATLEVEAYLGLVIEGTVVDARGESVHGARVAARPAGATGQVEARSGEDGSFTVGPLAAVSHSLVADSERHGPSGPVLARPGRSGVVLTLSPGPAIAVRVRGPDGGVPPRGIVRAFRKDAPSGATIRRMATLGDRVRRWASATELSVPLSDGRCELADLRPGIYDLLASSRDVGFALASDVEVRGSSRVEVVLDLVPFATLEVTNGRPNPAPVTVVFGDDLDVVGGRCEPGRTVAFQVPARVPLKASFDPFRRFRGPNVRFELVPGETRALTID